MAIFKYTGELYPQTGLSSVTGFNNGGTGNVTMKWAVSDQFVFDGDAEDLTADVLTITPDASGVTLNWSVDGTHNLNLRQYTGGTLPVLKTIGSGSFAFADGGKLIFGDGLTSTTNDDADNLIFSTVGNDYIDGLANVAADSNPLTTTGVRCLIKTPSTALPSPSTALLRAAPRAGPAPTNSSTSRISPAPTTTIS